MTVLHMLALDHIVMAHMGSCVVIVLPHAVSHLCHSPGRTVLCITTVTKGQNIENTVNFYHSGMQRKNRYSVHCAYSDVINSCTVIIVTITKKY